MTITEFEKTAFNGSETIIYNGKEYPLVSVDFKECLIGINEVDNDKEIAWKRCENCEVKEGKPLPKKGIVGLFWANGYNIKYIGILEDIQRKDGEILYCGCLSRWSNFEPLTDDLQIKLKGLLKTSHL